MWLGFRVSAMLQARIETEVYRRGPLFPSLPPSLFLLRIFSFFLLSIFFHFFLTLILRTPGTGPAKWALRSLLIPPPSAPATPHPTCLTTTSTVRDSAPLRQDGPSSSVLSDPPKRRQLLQKTGAARRIIILLYCHWVPPPPPSLLFLFFTLSPSFLILEPNVTTLGTFGRA